MRFIHSGNGKVLQIAEVANGNIDPALPARPQRLRLRLKSPVHPVQSIKSHTNYKSGFVHELGNDQCRYPVSDENALFCGARSKDNKSYCETHLKIIRR